MGAVWSALLVGGSLAGALLVWLLRTMGRKEGAEKEKDVSPGEAAAAGGDESGRGGRSPAPSRRALVTKPEYLQGSNGCLLSETRGPGNAHEAAWRLQSPSGEGGDCDSSREQVPSGSFPDKESLATSASGNSKGYSEVSRNESRESHIREWGFHKRQETPAKEAPYFAGKLPSSNLLIDRVKEEVSHAQMDSQDLADQDWEMVSRHSSWGDIGLSGSLESPALSPNQGMDYGRSALVEARSQEVDVKAKRVVAVSSESQQVSVRFQVHYITSTGMQFIAVTGDHERLGRWSRYIPLQYVRDGFWSRSVYLPAGIVVEWKFVVVENGKVTRWEECSNRLLETGHEDKMVHKCWGIH